MAIASLSRGRCTIVSVLFVVLLFGLGALMVHVATVGQNILKTVEKRSITTLHFALHPLPILDH